jgi:hypothetical protein
MHTSKNDEPIVNEEIWRAWVQKGKLLDQAAARRGRLLGGIAVITLAVGAAFYFLAAGSVAG